MKKELKNLSKLALCLLLCLGVGYIGNVFAQVSVVEWYPLLKHPSGTPPSTAFMPIGTILYVMMGVSLWLANHAHLSKQAYALFYLQLFFNLMWSFLFFGLQSIALGFLDILLIDVTLIATIWLFWKASRPAAVLLMPYLAWTLYVTYLNAALVVLNRG